MEATQQRVAIAEAYRHLSDLHYQLNDGMEAYRFLQQSHQIQDSILSVETQKNLQELGHNQKKKAKKKSHIVDLNIHS